MTSSREKTIYDVAIIGAGASGMTAAISCARYFLRYHTDKKANIIILERHAKSGRKLLATGNGRCNLSNENINSETLDRYFHSSQPEFYQKILSKFTVADTIEYFESMGIISTTLEDGKIYPYCKQAFSVVDALGNEMRELGVKVMHSCEVGSISKVSPYNSLIKNERANTPVLKSESTNQKIEKLNSKIEKSNTNSEKTNSNIENVDFSYNNINSDEYLFEITYNDLQDRENPKLHTIHAKMVIVSAGGKASPSLSSDGLGYALLGSLGHSTTPLHPSIVQLKTVKDINAGLDGLKWDVKISLIQEVAENASRALKHDTPLMAIVKEETGELLFTDYGISGPVVLQLARHACAIDESKFYALIDFLPEYSVEEILELLKKRIKSMGNRSIRRLLVGVLPFKLALAITDKIFKDKSEKPIRGITSQDLASLITKIKGYPFKITGTLGWDNAQVTAGGISCNEVDTETCESLLCKNLYITGEVLDVDGDCGGYNLQFAWASGYIAGESAARAICIKMNTASSSDNVCKFNKIIDSDSKLIGEQS